MRSEWPALGVLSLLILSLAVWVWSVQGYPSTSPAGITLCGTLAGRWGIETDMGCEARFETRDEALRLAWDRHWTGELLRDESQRDVFRRTRNNLAAVYLNRQEWDRAEALLVPVVEEAPGYADALVNLAVLYHERARMTRGDAGRQWLERARGLYLRALRLNPRHVQAQDGLRQLTEDWERM